MTPFIFAAAVVIALTPMAVYFLSALLSAVLRIEKQIADLIVISLPAEGESGSKPVFGTRKPGDCLFADPLRNARAGNVEGFSAPKKVTEDKNAMKRARNEENLKYGFPLLLEVEPENPDPMQEDRIREIHRYE